MANEIQQEAGFSLMDLASFNTDEVSVVLSRLPPVGVYTVKGLGVSAKMSEPKDDKPGLPRYAFDLETLEAKLAKKDVDAATLVGRKLKQSYTLWPNDMQNGIGLLKGMYQKVGLPNTGTMGGVEGANPGWLDNMVGHIFQIRVFHFNSNGQEQVGFDWIAPAPVEATA